MSCHMYTSLALLGSLCAHLTKTANSPGPGHSKRQATSPEGASHLPRSGAAPPVTSKTYGISWDVCWDFIV